ncbi:MAG: hypothetical protein V2A53_00655 [bacterium]
MPKRVKIGKIDKIGKRLITSIKSMGQEDFLDLSGNPKNLFNLIRSQLLYPLSHGRILGNRKVRNYRYSRKSSLVKIEIKS